MANRVRDRGERPGQPAPGGRKKPRGNKRRMPSIGGGVAATSPEARRRDLGSGSAAPVVISPEARRKGQMEVHPQLQRHLGPGSTGTPLTRSPEARRVMEEVFDYVGPWHPLNSNEGWSLTSDHYINSPSVSEYAFGSAGSGANPEAFRMGPIEYRQPFADGGGWGGRVTGHPLGSGQTPFVSHPRWDTPYGRGDMNPYGPTNPWAKYSDISGINNPLVVNRNNVISEIVASLLGG